MKPHTKIAGPRVRTITVAKQDAAIRRAKMMTSQQMGAVTRAANKRRRELKRRFPLVPKAEPKPNHVTWSHCFHRDHQPAFINYDDRLSVEGRLGYYYFGSVAGYAAKNHENTERAIARERERNHPLVWVSALPAVIDCSGQTGEQKAMRGAMPGARLHQLSLGAVVWFEGQTYQLRPAPNHNVALVPVRCDCYLNVIEEGLI